MEKLKIYLNSMLDDGKKITLKWDCGGDEAMVSIYDNGQELDYGDTYVQELTMYITNRISLPDAGEFSMDGGGEIIRKNKILILRCESILRGYEDFQMDTFEPLGWKEVNEVDQTYSGDFELFKD